MTEESVISEEFRRLVGVEAEPEVWEVEKGHIRRFAQAVGDPNPLWQDVEYARNSRYGNIVAPPTFLIDAGLVRLVDRLLEIECPLEANINGGTEIEYYRHMEVGDTITTVAKLSEVQEKVGKGGNKLIFLIIEVTYRNQKGELVAKCRNTFIRR